MALLARRVGLRRLASKVARADSAEEREALRRSEPDLVNCELIEGISLDGGRERSVDAAATNWPANCSTSPERLARPTAARVLARTLSR